MGRHLFVSCNENGLPQSVKTFPNLNLWFLCADTYSPQYNGGSLAAITFCVHLGSYRNGRIRRVLED